MEFAVVLDVIPFGAIDKSVQYAASSDVVIAEAPTVFERHVYASA